MELAHWFMVLVAVLPDGSVSVGHGTVPGSFPTPAACDAALWDELDRGCSAGYVAHEHEGGLQLVLAWGRTRGHAAPCPLDQQARRPRSEDSDSHQLMMLFGSGSWERPSLSDVYSSLTSSDTRAAKSRNGLTLFRCLGMAKATLRAISSNL